MRIAPLLWMLGLNAPPGPRMPPLPSFPGAKLVPIGRTGLGFFVTDETEEALASHFLARWSTEGLPTSGAWNGSESVVSGYLTREGWQLSVVMRRREGRTLALSSVLPMGGSPTEDDADDDLPREKDVHVWLARGSIERVAVELTRKISREGWKAWPDTSALGSSRLLRFKGHGTEGWAALAPLGEGEVAVAFGKGPLGFPEERLH